MSKTTNSEPTIVPTVWTISYCYFMHEEGLLDIEQSALSELSQEDISQSTL